MSQFGSPLSAAGSPRPASKDAAKAEFAARINKLGETFRALMHLAKYVGEKKRDLRIPRTILVQGARLAEDPVLGSTDLTALGAAFVSHLNKLKSGCKTATTSNRRGQGFNNPKLYNQKLVQLFTSARDAIGTVDVNEINRVRQAETDKEWVKKGGARGAAPRVPPVAILNRDSNYIVDQLSLVRGVALPNGTVSGIASPSILTPLMCVYAVKTKMNELAVAPPATARALKEKYLTRLAQTSQTYKAANRAHKAAHKASGLAGKADNLEVNGNFSAYLSQEQIASVMNDSRGIGSWANGQYLGATPSMRQILGNETFEEAVRKNRVKEEERRIDLQRKVNSGSITQNEMEQALVLKPAFSADYFPFSSLQVLTAINTVNGQAEIGRVLGADAGVLKKTHPSYGDLRNMLEAETDFLSAVLEWFNSSERVGGPVKGKSDVGKHAKKRVRAALGDSAGVGDLF